MGRTRAPGRQFQLLGWLGRLGGVSRVHEENYLVVPKAWHQKRFSWPDVGLPEVASVEPETKLINTGS